MGWIAGVAAAGGALLSGAMQSHAANNAASTQAGMSQQAIDEKRREFNQIQANTLPYRKGGLEAYNAMLGLEGLKPVQMQEAQPAYPYVPQASGGSGGSGASGGSGGSSMFGKADKYGAMGAALPIAAGDPVIGLIGDKIGLPGFSFFAHGGPFRRGEKMVVGEAGYPEAIVNRRGGVDSIVNRPTLMRAREPGTVVPLTHQITPPAHTMPYTPPESQYSPNTGIGAGVPGTGITPVPHNGGAEPTMGGSRTIPDAALQRIRERIRARIGPTQLPGDSRLIGPGGQAGAGAARSIYHTPGVQPGTPITPPAGGVAPGAGGSMTPATPAAPAPDNSGGSDGTGYDWQTDPGYQFRLQQGQQALENSALARGMGLSGASMKALERYNQGFASNEFGNVWNRLAGLSGTGQTMTNNLNNYGYGTAAGIGNDYGAMGAAMAGGQLGSANAWGNAINNGIGAFGYFYGGG